MVGPDMFLFNLIPPTVIRYVWVGVLCGLTSELRCVETISYLYVGMHVPYNGD